MATITMRYCNEVHITHHDDTVRTRAHVAHILRTARWLATVMRESKPSRIRKVGAVTRYKLNGTRCMVVAY